MKKIVFISGLSGKRRNVFLVKRILKNFDVEYFEYDTKLVEKIQTLAKKLKEFIDKIKLRKNEKIGIIGISAGGIIAHYYLKFLDNKKVGKIVTLCTPFKGTYLPRLYSKKRKGLQQLRSNSRLLKKINSKELAKGIKERNYWSFFDPVVPGTSGRGSNPTHTFFFLHWVIQYRFFTVLRIRKFFREKD
jgi:triacylglycerol esterase/lipase EstA (alpha/beta hydrolase family)